MPALLLDKLLQHQILDAQFRGRLLPWKREARHPRPHILIEADSRLSLLPYIRAAPAFLGGPSIRESVLEEDVAGEEVRCHRPLRPPVIYTGCPELVRPSEPSLSGDSDVPVKGEMNHLLQMWQKLSKKSKTSNIS
jgi:hypothetical protein